MKKVISCEYVDREITKVFNLLLADRGKEAHKVLYHLQKDCRSPESDFNDKET